MNRLLLAIDGARGGAVLRVALGACISFLNQGICGGECGAVLPVITLVGVLLALKVVPVFVRRAIPFPKDVQAEWEKRRRLTKQFDSYQWRKLFWIGLGMSVASSMGVAGSSTFALALWCLAAGSAGLLIWHRIPSVLKSVG